MFEVIVFKVILWAILRSGIEAQAHWVQIAEGGLGLKGDN